MERVEIKQKEKVLEYLKQEKKAEVKVRLIALNLIGKHNMSVEQVSETMAVPISTIYDWIRIWNENGYDGLKGKPQSSGRPAKLSEEDMKNLKDYLVEKPYWLTKEVRHLIEEKLGVKISEDQVRRILRDKLKMLFSKPYPLDYRRPAEAEEILARNWETTMRLLKEKGVKEEEIAIGFIDESSPQLTSNTVRVWSFGDVEIFKNTELRG